MPKKENQVDVRTPVVTLCMEPGSQGCLVANKIAELLGFELYNRDIIKAIAKSMKTGTDRVDMLEKERFSGIEDFIASLIEEKYLHNDVYMEHLVKVVRVIADRGNAVIVGRGANFILPFENRFAVRIIAPSETRVANIVRAFGAEAETARLRITRREARRQAFIRQAFNKDIRNPSHYDITLNTARLSVTAAAEAIVAAAVDSEKATGVA
ncbi:MAG: cytidylate kinase-like family protein [Desulfobacterales bacterium]|nr:cytidylate kinase-like family protein [Desulfobacterales bacterium]